MVLQKQKNLLLRIRVKFDKKLIAWSALSSQLPLLLLVVVFGAVLFAQTMATPTTAGTLKTITKTSTVPHLSALPKIAQPVIATLEPATTLPTSTYWSTGQAGTPKQEPVVTPSPSSSVSGLTPTTSPSPPSSQAPPSSPKTTTGYMSTNWSGYLATNASFTGISGSWTATDATGNGSSTSADSTWIGIGGVTTSDLIQVGTQNIITSSGRVSASVFYELLPGASQPVPGVTVSPGDNISASLSEVSSGQWTISITDKTDGQSDTFSVSYSSSLSSAEWIEEDPSYSSGRQIPFDNFDEAAFTNGSVTLNGSTTSIATSTAQPVTMVNKSGQAVAVPSVIGSDGASFTVTP